MSDFLLRIRSGDSTDLSDVARHLGVPDPGGGELSITGVAPVATAGPHELGFLASERYLSGLQDSRAGALLVARDLAHHVEGDGRPRLIVPDAHQALARLLERFFPEGPRRHGIHPTAVVEEGARLGEGVAVGPFAVVEAGAVIGAGTRLGAHCVVGAGAEIGEECALLPHAVVYPGTVLGRRVILHAGARIGVDGFGYVFVEGAHRKVPQVGRCVVGDDVEIGANTTLDRGSIGDTAVGEGTKIDNLVQLGHNVTVGRHAVLASQVGVAGSTRIGHGVLAGGQAGIGGHLDVGDGAQLGGQAGIIGDIAAGETVVGYPARPRREFLRVAAAQSRVPDLLKRVRALEAEVARLRGDSEDEGPDPVA